MDLRPVWTRAENLAPPEFDHRTVQHLTNCYTIYAIMFAIRHPRLFFRNLQFSFLKSIRDFARENV
jgi:hypothetical protein